MTNLVDWIKANLGISVFNEDWQEGDEGVDYLDFTSTTSDMMVMLEEAYDFLFSEMAWPGTELSLAVPFAAGLVVIPIWFVLREFNLNVYDLIFAYWLYKISPIKTVSAVGIPIPVPIVAYMIIKDVKVPVFGDGSITQLAALKSGTPTKFGGHTDGTFTFKDMFMDMFIVWFLYKLGRNLGPNAVIIAIRLVLWAIDTQSLGIKHVFERLKDPNVSRTYLTGYGEADGEVTIYELLEDFFDDYDTESDTGKKGKDYIKKIHPEFRGVA